MYLPVYSEKFDTQFLLYSKHCLLLVGFEQQIKFVKILTSILNTYLNIYINFIPNTINIKTAFTQRLVPILTYLEVHA